MYRLLRSVIKVPIPDTEHDRGSLYPSKINMCDEYKAKTRLLWNSILLVDRYDRLAMDSFMKILEVKFFLAKDNSGLQEHKVVLEAISSIFTWVVQICMA